MTAPAYYNSLQVDGLMKAASRMMWALTEELASAQAANDELQKQAARYKAAATGRIELEKVASPVAVDRAKVNEFIDTLVDHAIIDEQHREKFAAACLANTEAMLDVAIQAIRASESPASQGAGYINKTATRVISEVERLKAEEAAVYRQWL